MQPVHKNITVYGHVQGVYFRASAKYAADRLGVTGIVKNEPDGSVFAEAEGDEAAVGKFVDWCRSGPPAARVSNIAVTDGQVKGYAAFEVIR